MRIYLFVALLSLGYLPFVKLTFFGTDYVNIIRTDKKRVYCTTLPNNDANRYLHQFVLLGHTEPNHILDPPPKDSLDFSVGSFYWGVGTDSIRQRINTLRQESDIFDKVLAQLEDAEYPFSIISTHLNDATGTFSSLNGELRFSTDKMQGFLFDATIIEEFVHAYQAVFYEYAHGNCLKRDYQFAQRYGDAVDKVKIEKRTGNWEKFGRKHAYIESEAKIICYLIQNQCSSISLQNIADTDDYNSGGKAKSILYSYLKARNCLQLRRVDRLNTLEDYYIEYERFMRYQYAFVKHWRRHVPGCTYTKGLFRHRPEALQALSNQPKREN